MDPLTDSRTKVVCTLGPASRDEETVRALIAAGMDIARVNLAHGEHEQHAATIARVRRAARDLEANVAVMADLQGPKRRIGTLGVDSVDLNRGDAVVLVPGTASAASREIPVPDAAFLETLEEGSSVVLGDGRIVLEVRGIRCGRVDCTVQAGGRLASRQGLRGVRTRPGATTSALSPKDLDDLRFAVSQGVDVVALSFVGGAQDIEVLRAHIERLAAEPHRIAILAKIERRDAVSALDAILDTADAVMVARGDLGIEIPPEELPMLQKEIIERCRRAATPVVTATQMLLSMVDSHRPTRAEASDVANAVLDGTDAVMLSEETAVGRHPVTATEMMGRIARIAESKTRQQLEPRSGASVEGSRETTNVVSEAAARIADRLGVRLIAAATSGGYTARRIARERPTTPIIALSPSAVIARRLALTWGVHPLSVPAYTTAEEMVSVVSSCLQTAGLARTGDLVLITGGLPVGCKATNFLRVHRIEEAEGQP